MKGIVVLLSLFVFVGVLWISDDRPEAKLPWHTQGNHFTVEWIVPEGTVYYRGYLSGDSASIVNNPFSCQYMRIPPPLKVGEKQSIVVRYPLRETPYDIYVEIFAFDIDGNYKNLDLLHFKEDNL
jgi:hypothetical protein